MMTDQAIPDQESRKQALDPQLSFIVQAPAGSGKTELLIQRYLRLLSMVDAPEEIVAITFTRKAASEMRIRVIEALEIASGSAAEHQSSRLTDDLAHAALTQDKKLGWQITQNPGRLRIQTIDSLTASLTRQMPVLSQFGAQPETLEDASELYQLAADSTIFELESGDRWSEAIAVLLKHLDNDLPRIRNMLATMLARRDQWLRHVVRQQQRVELEGALIHLVESELQQFTSSFPDDYAEEILTLARYAGNNLLSQKKDSALNLCADLENLPGTFARELNIWQALVGLLLTKDDKWRKAANVNLGFPAPSANKSESELRGAMKDRYAALLSRLSGEKQLLDDLVRIKYLPPIFYSDDEWQFIDALYQLLVLADAQLRLLFAERNQMDFTGITQAAIQALGEADAPTDLALHLDYQYKHILVDEFQDISINQYLLMERLTAGWSSGDGHTLFLVGDPMQSIYRFREAEVGLFLNVWQQKRLNQVALRPLNITVNFRSNSGLVDWLNDAFKKILPQQSAPLRGAVNYAPAVAYHVADDDKAVELIPLAGRDDVAEAQIINDLIKQSRADNSQDSIAILVRNRSHLREIIEQLRHSGIQYRAVEIEGLESRAAIQDLLALTLALTHLADRVAWLSVLRAPWCGLTLKDLYELVGKNKDKSVWECLHDEDCLQNISETAKQRLEPLITTFDAAFQERSRLRLGRWVKSVWLSLGGPACIDDESDLLNSRRFFQLLDEHADINGLRDRSAFVHHVLRLYAAPNIESDEAVQIMTIHKAKGLEFDTVIVPGLARGSGMDDPSLLLWMELPHGKHQDLLLAPVKSAGQADSPIYSYLRRLEKEKQSYELGRLLYVAATRAKKHLRLISTFETSENADGQVVTMPRKDSLLAQLWPVAKSVCDHALNNQSEQLKNLVKQTDQGGMTVKRLESGWRLPLPPTALTWNDTKTTEQRDSENISVEYEWAGETIIHIGTVVHASIQMLSEESGGLWSKQRVEALESYHRAMLLKFGVGVNELRAALSSVQTALQNMIEDKRSNWLFSNSHKDVRNEYALSGILHDKVMNVVLDKTFIDSDDTRWIVDYKTSRHEGGNVDAFLDQQQQRYKGQLHRYAQLFRGMEERPIKLGLYFPLLKGWREWEFK